MSVIDVRGLQKVFKVPVREAGLANAIKSLVVREHKDVTAVSGVDIKVEEGEIVGFLGANGAGKTTTLKMLSGLLHPTDGKATVLGHIPWQRNRDFLRQITLVMGNRNQLQWDLPVVDSFEMNRAIFAIPRPDFESARNELVELLDIGDLITKPVRNLSLGERMKAEIAGALLHRPQVLFLDEPTIGLDVTMQKRIRGFLADYNQRHGASIMLTSHYMADVQALCKRVVVIHHGVVLYDGALTELANRFEVQQTIHCVVDDPDLNAARLGVVVSFDDGRLVLRVDRSAASAVAARLLTDHHARELSVEDLPIDDVIEQVFATGDRSASDGAATSPSPEPWTA